MGVSINRGKSKSTPQKWEDNEEEELVEVISARKLKSF